MMKKLPLALAVLAATATFVASNAEAVEPGSQLIGCDQADVEVHITQHAHLDPSCTYGRTLHIEASNVTLDCQGAQIKAPDRRYGIYIHAPQSQSLQNIKVQNCHVEGFLNNYHIEHEDFRTYTVENEYENAFSNIVIENSTSLNSRGVGIFVNGYTSGVTLRNLHVEGASSTGIYLEHGSKDNVVEDSTIVNNGFGENGPNGQTFEVAGVTFWFWGTGREGLAIDGSRFNVVRNNYFSGNADGGIFLYKNCGEFVNSRPQRWWHRRYGADGNLIEGNTFDGGNNGVWIGSRMGENTAPMECSDPAYVSDGFARVVRDYAADNTVKDNVFNDVQYAVRVEDDRSTITGNTFNGSNPAQQAILVGTPLRTSVLGLPVDEAVITGNRSFITGNQNPYRWVHGHTDTTFSDNQSAGRVVGFCEGVEPRRNALIFVLAFTVYDPQNPPTGGPPTFPAPAPLPPCPITCESGAVANKASIAIRRLGTPAGDDTLLFKGESPLPFPYTPAIDPVTTGVGLLISDADGGRIIDLTIPGGAYSAATRIGWKPLPSGGWRYTNRSLSPAGGITSILIKDLSKRSPGLLQFTVKGARGTYVVDTTKLPLTGVLTLDPPTAETGQCGATSFPAASSCRADGKSVVCR